MNPFSSASSCLKPLGDIYFTALKQWQRSQIAALLFWYIIYCPCLYTCDAGCDPRRCFSKSAALRLFIRWTCIVYIANNCLLFPPETCRGAFLVWLCLFVTQCLPTVDARPAILIFITCPLNEVNGAWFSQQVVWLPGPSDNCLPHAVWKIPPFSGEIYEGGSVPLSSQQPLWSHSPLVDCLPNGHWQMGLKIASLAPQPQKPTVVGQHAAAFPSLNFSLLIFSFLSSLSLCVPSSSNYASIFPLASLLFLVSFIHFTFCLNGSW